jgi:hypothetical protein
LKAKYLALKITLPDAFGWRKANLGDSGQSWVAKEGKQFHRW